MFNVLFYPYQFLTEITINWNSFTNSKITVLTNLFLFRDGRKRFHYSGDRHEVNTYRSKCSSKKQIFLKIRIFLRCPANLVSLQITKCRGNFGYEFWTVITSFPISVQRIFTFDWTVKRINNFVFSEKHSEILSRTFT